MMMSEYKIGALSKLISSSNDGKFASLFTKDKKQKEMAPPAPPSKIDKEPENNGTKIKSKVKKKAKTEKNVSKINQKGDPKIKKGALKDEKKNSINDEDEPDMAIYSQPSLKRKVQMEDSKKGELDESTEKRTIFVGNIPLKAAKKKLIMKLFKKYGSIECVRFRGAARPDLKTTKRVAVITKTIHEKRESLNAYVRFEEESSVAPSLEVNGTCLENHVLRVDAAFEDSTKKDKDPKKAVFLGNLDFKINEDVVRQHFLSCGKILDVRIVRDPKTGMGKGFGYVNFEKDDSVEIALNLNGSKLGSREIRVSRSTRKPKALIPKDSGKLIKSKSKETKTNPEKPRSKELKNKKKMSKKEFKDKVANSYVGLKQSKNEIPKKKSIKTRKNEFKKKEIARKLLRK